MTSKIPPSAKGAFAVIQEIVRMGTVDIPPQFKGSGAPGDTLEYLLNVTRNNYDTPDLKDWEVKFHGGKSLLTLLHKTPQPKGIMNKMVNAFGWEDKKGRISFRHTLKGQSDRGFIVMNEKNRITIINTNDSTIAPYWEHNVVLNTIGAKLRRLILVHGTVSKSKRQVTYDNAVAFWDLDLLNIFQAMKEGFIKIDFDVRTTKGRGTSLRDHGTKWRIKIGDVGALYENSAIII